MKKIFITLSLGLIISTSSLQAFAAQADDISVSSPFVREVPPGVPASASFMTLTNQSNKAIKLVLADSKVARTIELHTHINDNGVMRMRKVPFMEIPANGSLQLKPGGLHIMLIDPYKPIRADQIVSLKLEFADGSHKRIEVPVKSFKDMIMENGTMMKTKHKIQLNQYQYHHY